MTLQAISDVLLNAGLPKGFYRWLLWNRRQSLNRQKNGGFCRRVDQIFITLAGAGGESSTKSGLWDCRANEILSF